MNTKQLVFTCLIVTFLLSGCGGKVALGKGGGKYTIPFDFSHEKTDLDNKKTSGDK